MPARYLCWLSFMVAVAVAAGCGYSLAGRGSFLPTYIKKIAIPTLENRTATQRLELILTQKIREEFIGRGKFEVVPEVTDADAVLRGEIIGFTPIPAALNQQQLSSRYRIVVIIKVAFTDRRTNEVLWSNDALTFQDEYDLAAQGPVEAATFVDQQGSAVDRIATDAARTVVTAIVEAF